MQPARRFLVSRMGTSGTYNGRYLNIRTCDFQASFSSASVQGKHFVCPHLCWDEVFISGFCVI